jgi:30S ribosomal protein S31
MGKGDRRSRRGKIFRGTFGATRKHKLTKTTPPTSASTSTEATSEAPKKKAPKKKKEE